MDLSQIQFAMSVGSLVVAGVMAHVIQTAKSEVLRLRAEIAEGRLAEAQARERERDELRKWINGSFMRTSLVEARWTELIHRVGELERNA